MIKAILFDYGGVYGGEGFSALLRRLARISGRSYETVFNLGFKKICIEDGFVKGKVTEDYFWHKILKGLNIPPDKVDIDQLREYMYKQFKPRKYMEKLVDNLRSSHAVGLLSDQTRWLDELDRRYNIYSHFDYLFLSFKIGLSKHDPEIFDYACRKMSVQPSEVFFIDDNADNIRVAKTRGLVGHVYKDYDTLVKRMRELGILKNPVREKKKIPLEEALKPYIKDLEEALEQRHPSPVLYFDGISYRLRLLKNYIQKIQERYGFEIFEDS